MANWILFGAQWGDEGKGKIVDMLASELDYVARYQGGNNAGHTVIVGEEKHVLHIIPSGILHPHAKCVIGNGVVLDPEVFLKEIDALEQKKIDASPKRISISYATHLIMDYHKQLDQAREGALDEKIGTTGRGIGPAYEDKKARIGIRVGDLLNQDTLKKKIEIALKEKNTLFKNLYNASTFSVDEVFQKLQSLAPRILPYLDDTTGILQEAIKAKKAVLFEGAQGSMLDIDHGTYPFVTSSNTIADNAAVGAGVPNCLIDKRLAVVKAYTTRVGSGPFPTELKDEIGQRIQKIGVEFGATTGRTRRCGWLDAVMLRETARLCAPTDLAITKLDVLTGLDEICICKGYEYKGKVLDYPPQIPNALDEVKPIYESFPGWEEDISEVLKFEDLPKNAQNYVHKIEEIMNAKASIVSVGPDRDQTMQR